MGNFVKAKSERKFSLIAIDHGHEQNNAIVKEEGGLIGLTQDLILVSCRSRTCAYNLRV